MCRTQILWMSCLCLLVSSSALIAAPANRKGNASAAQPAREANWTLYCQAIGGPAHVEQSKAVKEQLMQSTGLKDWYVIHQENESVLYHGFYQTFNDPKDRKESDRAQRDRKEISALTDGAGNRLFDHCFFVEISSPDPTAPPEWNLVNSGGFWSLQIAAYKESPQRKAAAVEAVAAARAAGVQAFYYHGETTSSVCIGSWPREAVREQDEEVAGASDPEQDLLVLPQPLLNQDKIEIRNQEGRRVRALAPRFEPTDPALIAMMAKYPTHSVNGVTYVSKAKDPATGQVTEFEDPSFIVQVPRPKASLLRAEQPAPTLVAPPSRQAPGGGRLRSIGD